MKDQSIASAIHLRPWGDELIKAAAPDHHCGCVWVWNDVLGGKETPWCVKFRHGSCLRGHGLRYEQSWEPDPRELTKFLKKLESQSPREDL
jgi:hypothetical protein